MTAVFDLTLDTRAPAVTWDEPTGTTAGELLQLPYVSDEAIEDAWLILNGGQRLELTVLADRLEVLLPPDAQNGAATVHFRDDVWNEGTHTVLLTGVVVAPEETPGVPRGPGPSPDRSRRRRVLVEANLRLQSEVPTPGPGDLALHGHLALSVVGNVQRRRVVFDRKHRVESGITVTTTSSLQATVAGGPGLGLAAAARVEKRDADEDLLTLLL